MKKAYIDKKFHKNSLNIINYANKIIEKYTEQGYSLTLRQLYYQFVARDKIPNTQNEYKKLGSIINDARLAGLIDWDHVCDLTRNLRILSTWENPSDIMRSVLHSYRIDKWKHSPFYVEVWVEKDALIEVIQNAADKYEVPCFSCRGYVSQSAMYKAAKRFYCKRKENYILHLGDHDPSGIDMTRDIQKRMQLFDADVCVVRIALNLKQIEKYRPPPNPAKITDSRYAKYVQKYGNESWELDALEPIVIDRLIQKNVLKYFDTETYNQAIEQEEKDTNKILEIINSMESDE